MQHGRIRTRISPTKYEIEGYGTKSEGYCDTDWTSLAMYEFVDAVGQPPVIKVSKFLETRRDY